MILYFYGFLHTIAWLFFFIASFGLIKSSKFKINLFNLPSILMILTALLLLTAFSFMGGIYVKIYFGLSVFLAVLEMIILNTQIEGISKNNVTFLDKILQFALVVFFVPQHILFMISWFVYFNFGSNEELKP